MTRIDGQGPLACPVALIARCPPLFPARPGTEGARHVKLCCSRAVVGVPSA